MPEVIKEQLSKALPHLLTYIVGTIAVVATNLLPDEVLSKIDTSTWARLTVGLGALCLYLLVWSLHLRKKLKEKPDFKPYSHNSEKGYWQHSKTKERICSACKLDGNLSPLYSSHGGWRCPKHQNTVGREESAPAAQTGVNYHMR